MIVAIGYRTAKPPERVRSLLNGKLLRKRSIKGIHSYTKFVIQDLNTYKLPDGGYLSVITEPDIKWREDDGILIGEV